MQVLSANPADLAGPLIMARQKPGDPHQLWYQDFWNQFGCSSSKAGLGMLGETCHTKSKAFVLINKATKQLVWAGEQGQPLRLAPYSMGSDADLTRRCTLFDQASRPQADVMSPACLGTLWHQEGLDKAGQALPIFMQHVAFALCHVCKAALHSQHFHEQAMP